MEEMQKVPKAAPLVQFCREYKDAKDVGSIRIALRSTLRIIKIWILRT